jgi:hypothetical protein
VGLEPTTSRISEHPVDPVFSDNIELRTRV